MFKPSIHKFHIPVMGTGFTIDTPLKIAKFGISSVISLVDDTLIEKMRKYYSEKFKHDYSPIKNGDEDKRARRITAYLNLVDEIVKSQIDKMRKESFSSDSDLTKYFELLPKESELKQKYLEFKAGKIELEDELKRSVVAGSIDVNIMTKLDRDNYKGKDRLPVEYSDALSALRGYAESKLRSNIVFSAGLNSRLYSYIEKFDDFFPDDDGELKKKVIIKVSDYRSAMTQGRVLTRKGIWISEFRIESGLNCGGHAFATNGNLIGPTLDEFRVGKDNLAEKLHANFVKGLLKKTAGITVPEKPLPMQITVQGGLTSSVEQRFLLDHYNVSTIGWGTPFLLVPESTSVDDSTLQKLIDAKDDDVFMSPSSPLGVIFQNLKSSASELARIARIKAGKPGSTCPKGHLSFNTEFTDSPICVASNRYQKFKLSQLEESELSAEELEAAKIEVTNKSCICHELGGGALIKYGIETPEKINPAICPGPSLAIFSKMVSLKDMVSHIYGDINIIEGSKNPGMFMTELRLYIDELKNKISKNITNFTEKEQKDILSFAKNLSAGIEYYKNILSVLITVDSIYAENLKSELTTLKNKFEELASKHNLSLSF